jgi:hypothetical protein
MAPTQPELVRMLYPGWSSLEAGRNGDDPGEDPAGHRFESREGARVPQQQHAGHHRQTHGLVEHQQPGPGIEPGGQHVQQRRSECEKTAAMAMAMARSAPFSVSGHNSSVRVEERYMVGSGASRVWTPPARL